MERKNEMEEEERGLVTAAVVSATFTITSGHVKNYAGERRRLGVTA